MRYHNLLHGARIFILTALFFPLTLHATVLTDFADKPGDFVIATVLDHQVTLSELQEITANISDQDRSVLTKDHDAFETYVKRLVMRSYFVAQAEKASLQNNDIIEFAVRQAYDAAMIDLWFSQEVKSEQDFPSQALIQETYENNQDQFVTPGQVNLSQIFLLKTTDIDTDRQRIEDVSAAIKSDPTAFSSLAASFSDDESGNQSNGNLGWVPVNQMKPEIMQAIGNLQIGDISLPIQTQQGTHFILINDILPASRLDIEDVESQIVDALRNRDKETKQQQIVNEIFNSVDVKSIK